MRADITDLVLRSGARPICGGSFLGACFTPGTSHGLTGKADEKRGIRPRYARSVGLPRKRWKCESVADSLSFVEAQLQILVKVRVDLRHGLRFVRHREIVDVTRNNRG